MFNAFFERFVEMATPRLFFIFPLPPGAVARHWATVVDAFLARCPDGVFCRKPSYALIGTDTLRPLALLHRAMGSILNEPGIASVTLSLIRRIVARTPPALLYERDIWNASHLTCIVDHLTRIPYKCVTLHLVNFT
jgi:hypothetical protein